MASYDEFRHEYELRHPASVPMKRLEASPFPWWVKWVALAMFLSSALLSGVHTVPVVREGIPTEVVEWLASVAAGSAFISIELAIFVSTFALIGGGSPTVWGVLILSSLTALGANIYAVIQAYTDAIKQTDQFAWGTLVVAVLIGIVAPGVAYLSGRLYVNLQRANRKLSNEADSRYLADRKAWDREINDAWEAVQKRVQNVSNEQPNKQERPKASFIVRQHFTDYPEDLDNDRSLREIADQLGVSHGTVYNVKLSMLSNGHSLEADE